MHSQRTFTTTSKIDEDGSSLYDISQTDADAMSGVGFQPTFAKSRADTVETPANLDGKPKSQRADNSKLAFNSSHRPTSNRVTNQLAAMSEMFSSG